MKNFLHNLRWHRKTVGIHHRLKRYIQKSDREAYEEYKHDVEIGGTSFDEEVVKVPASKLKSLLVAARGKKLAWYSVLATMLAAAVTVFNLFGAPEPCGHVHDSDPSKLAEEHDNLDTEDGDYRDDCCRRPRRYDPLREA